MKIFAPKDSLCVSVLKIAAVFIHVENSKHDYRSPCQKGDLRASVDPYHSY